MDNQGAAGGVGLRENDILDELYFALIRNGKMDELKRQVSDMLQRCGWTGKLSKRVAEYKRKKALEGAHATMSEMITAMLPRGKVPPEVAESLMKIIRAFANEIFSVVPDDYESVNQGMQPAPETLRNGRTASAAGGGLSANEIRDGLYSALFWTRKMNELKNQVTHMLQVSGWTDEMTKRVAEYEKEKALHGEPVNQSEITSAMLPLMLPNGKVPSAMHESMKEILRAFGNEVLTAAQHDDYESADQETDSAPETRDQQADVKKRHETVGNA